MIRRVVLSLLAAAAVVSPATAATVITGERMLDVETGRYVQNPAIFVDDTGHITSIADARTVRWGADVKHIDLGNRTLLPGLIDMHTHLGPADIGGYRFLEYTGSFWPVVATSTARDMLNGGFTTMRVVGSGEWADVGLKQAIEAGYVVGPRIVPAGHALGATGELRVLDDTSGKVIWRTNILSDSDARNLDWGMAAAPLIVATTTTERRRSSRENPCEGEVECAVPGPSAA